MAPLWGDASHLYVDAGLHPCLLYHDTTLYPTTYYDTIFQALRLDIEAEVVARHALQHPFLPPETVARAEVAAVSAPRAEAC